MPKEIGVSGWMLNTTYERNPALVDAARKLMRRQLAAKGCTDITDHELVTYPGDDRVHLFVTGWSSDDA